MSQSDESGREGDGRLVGVRTPYDSAPPALHAWAAETLGAPVVDVRPRIGGMSPAVAASLRATNGARAFVKAVCPAINPNTPDHFRHEIAVLSVLADLPPRPYRARLMSTYDDGDWVAIALEDIDGRHPDWSSEADRAAVFEAVRRQSAELTPIPARLPSGSIRDVAVKHLTAMRNATPAEVAGLSGWTASRLGQLTDLAQQSLDNHRDESFCHWDIRHDNILIRLRDGQPMMLDWGMSRRGPHWADTMIFALEWVDSRTFDDIMSSIGLTDGEQDDVTGFLAGAGCYLAMTSTYPPPPSMPKLRAFRRQVGAACLRGVRRRLA